MKVKPKEVMVNLPVALLFDEPWEIISFAANINTILHGKVKLKVDELGILGGRSVGIFYLDRNAEYHEIRDEFVRLIEQEEVVSHSSEPYVPGDSLADQYDPNYGDNNECLCGHEYYRHFDTYDDMAPIGCKYCYKYGDKHIHDHSCPGFKPKGMIDAHPREEDKYAHGLCSGCEEHDMLHQKGEDHCRCGAEIKNGVCKVLERQYAKT